MKNRVASFIGVAAPVVVLAGQAATLNCSVASDGYTLDWNSQSYQTGSLAYATTLIRDGSTSGASNSDPVGATVSVSGQTQYISTNYPAQNNEFTGGLGAA